MIHLPQSTFLIPLDLAVADSTYLLYIYSPIVNVPYHYVRTELCRIFNIVITSPQCEILR